MYLRVLEITATLLTMPLFTDLPAGRTYERHGHGAVHGADLLGVRGLAVGTDDALAAGEVLLFLDFSLHLLHVMGDLKILLLLFPLLALAFKNTLSLIHI